MKIDRDHADDELLGHLGAGQALCEEAQHLQFTRGEVSMRLRGNGCRGWDSERRLWRWHRFQAKQDMFWCHGSPFGPGSIKGLLSQLHARGSEGQLMHRLRQGWQRRSDGLT